MDEVTIRAGARRYGDQWEPVVYVVEDGRVFWRAGTTSCTREDATERARYYLSDHDVIAEERVATLIRSPDIAPDPAWTDQPL